MRALVIGGGCRALDLTRALVAEGHAVRAVTRREEHRAAIEAAGADRVVTALAAHELYGRRPDGRGRPVVVVDFGTSTNVDAVGPDGQFLGGALAPGVEVSLEALATRAAQLRSVELTVPPQAIGKNTVAALQSGLVLGFAGLVDGLVARIAGETAPLLFTALNNNFWFNPTLMGGVSNLPVMIYQFALSPYQNWRELAWAGALVITLSILALSIVARLLLKKDKALLARSPSTRAAPSETQPRRIPVRRCASRSGTSTSITAISGA